MPLAYVNQFGGQDELVFDGASFVLNRGGGLALQMPAWDAVTISEWRPLGRWLALPAGRACDSGGRRGGGLSRLRARPRDYVEKNGFPGVVLGLSGGIDSALTAAIAVDALGAERVHCVMLPYRYTSNESLSDAAACAEALGRALRHRADRGAGRRFHAALRPFSPARKPGITEENLQSRTRGTILMAISNKFGSMLVTTGNKSEVSVGYATLYGDMNGGFNPIKDLYKMQVYALSRYRNACAPEGLRSVPAVLSFRRTSSPRRRPPSCARTRRTRIRCRPMRCSTIFWNASSTREMPLAEIVTRGHDDATVRKIERLLYLAEYKRRQSAPGVKITSRNFGRDRRYPITNKFRETK